MKYLNIGINIFDKFIPNNKILEVIGRAFISLLFLYSAYGKIFDEQITYLFLASRNLLWMEPFVFISTFVEVLGSILIIIGWRVRYVALIMAGYIVVTTLMFWHDFSDHLNVLMFLKDIGIAAGFVMLASKYPSSKSY